MSVRLRLHVWTLLLIIALGQSAFCVPTAGSPTPVPPADGSPSPTVGTAATKKGPVLGWIDRSATVSDEDVRRVVDAIAANDPDPTHIVVLVHGLATPRAASKQQYETVATEIDKAWRARGARPVVVGLQWDSDVGSQGGWVPRLIASLVGFGKNPYFEKIKLARAVGRSGARQLLLAVRHRFPQARIDILTHSLGAEMVRLVLHPESEEPVSPGAPPAHAIGNEVGVNVFCLAGADIDYDTVYNHRSYTVDKKQVGLYWITVGGVRDKDASDQALGLRSLIRGRALGDDLPRARRGQVDAFCSTTSLVLDGRRIPTNHLFLSYYTPDRIDRLADVSVALSDPAHPSALLESLSAIVHAPNDVGHLTPYLARTDISSQYYTLWRLDNLLCGSCQHLGGGYLERVGRMLRDDPTAIERERVHSPCLIVREGLWPTPAMVARALTQQPGVAGRPQPPEGAYQLP